MLIKVNDTTIHNTDTACNYEWRHQGWNLWRDFVHVECNGRLIAGGNDALPFWHALEMQCVNVPLMVEPYQGDSAKRLEAKNELMRNALITIRDASENQYGDSLSTFMAFTARNVLEEVTTEF